MARDMGEPVKGMRPARILAPIFSANTPREIQFSKQALHAGVIGLMLENCAWIANFPHLSPDVYRAGIIYKPEKHRVKRGNQIVEYGEDWQTIPYVLYHGFGDCEDLGAYRAAWLRMMRGEKATPIVRVRRLPDGAWRAHVQVKRGNGFIEDPSAKLGMYYYGNATTGAQIDAVAVKVRRLIYG